MKYKEQNKHQREKKKKIDNSTNNAKEDNHIYKGDTNNGTLKQYNVTQF